MYSGIRRSPEHVAHSGEQTEQDLCTDLFSQAFTLLQFWLHFSLLISPSRKKNIFSLLLAKSIRDQASKSPTEIIMPCYETADVKTETTGD